MRALTTKLTAAASLVAAVGALGAAAPSPASAATPRVVIGAHVVAGTQLRPLASVPLRIGLEFYVPPRDPAALTSFIASVSTPGSPSYHHYLGRGRFAARFGATAATIAHVSAYLAAHRMTLVTTSPDHLFIHATGAVRDVEALLHTRIGQFALKGHRVYANTTPAVLPAAISRQVRTVVGLSDVPEARTSFSIRPHARTASTDCSSMSAGTSATTGPFTIAEAGAAYKYGAFASHGAFGQGQTVAVYELTNYLASDVSHYADCLAQQTPPAATAAVSGVMVDGGGGINFNAAVEAALDIEIVATLAPQSNVMVYQGPNAPAGAIDTYHRIALDDAAKVVSTSWGFCESADKPTVTAESAIFAEMAAQGQSVVAAAGDTGASDCLGYFSTRTNPIAGAIGVDDPASQPYVTGIGGTTVANAASIGTNPNAEVVWDTADQAGGGGGVSSLWPQPTWQAGVAGTSTSGRSVPDLSIDADPASGYMIYSLGAGGWADVGGTSCGAPMVAALLALANQYNSTTLGFVNPLLYQVAVQHPGVNFSDVTLGNNKTYDIAGFDTAAVGYDDASGWGSPIASSFLGGDI